MELTNIRNKVNDMEADYKTTIDTPDRLGRLRRTTFVNSEGLIDLVMSSRKPEARAFQKWALKLITDKLHEEYEQLQQNLQEREKQLYTLQSTTRVVLDKHEEAISISVWERAVHHGYVEEDLVRTAYTPIEVTYQGMVTTMDHPNKRVFMSKKTNISKLLSNKMWSLHGKRPGFGKGRKNVYFEKDWVEYGDEILQRYFEENPVEEWGLLL